MQVVNIINLWGATRHKAQLHVFWVASEAIYHKIYWPLWMFWLLKVKYQQRADSTHKLLLCCQMLQRPLHSPSSLFLTCMDHSTLKLYALFQILTPGHHLKGTSALPDFLCKYWALAGPLIILHHEKNGATLCTSAWWIPLPSSWVVDRHQRQRLAWHHCLAGGKCVACNNWHTWITQTVNMWHVQRSMK